MSGLGAAVGADRGELHCPRFRTRHLIPLAIDRGCYRTRAVSPGNGCNILELRNHETRLIYTENVHHKQAKYEYRRRRQKFKSLGKSAIQNRYQIDINRHFGNVSKSSRH